MDIWNLRYLSARKYVNGGKRNNNNTKEPCVFNLLLDFENKYDMKQEIKVNSGITLAKRSIPQAVVRNNPHRYIGFSDNYIRLNQQTQHIHPPVQHDHKTPKGCLCLDCSKTSECVIA